jgi:hypothetical protein
MAKRVLKNVKHCSKCCSVSGGYVIKQNNEASILFVIMVQKALHFMKCSPLFYFFKTSAVLYVEQRPPHPWSWGITKIKVPSALPRKFLISVVPCS